jgi:hypothetical protein
MSQDLNPQIQRPVYHLIDAYSHQDAATHDLSDAFLFDRATQRFAGLVVSAQQPELLRRDDKSEYKQQVNQFLESELYEYQWFCALHADTQHIHTHLVASRIHLLSGKCIPTWQDHERSHRICRLIEQEHGLQPLQSYSDLQRRSPTRGQREKWQKTGVAPVMVTMQDAIDQEATPGRAIQAVMIALKEKHGIETKTSPQTGKPGVVFEQLDPNGARVRMSGSQLGRGYTLPALQRRLQAELAAPQPVLSPPTANPPHRHPKKPRAHGIQR